MEQRPLLGGRFLIGNESTCKTEEAVFYLVRAATVATQRSGKHASAVTDELQQ
jgi:hypothetical protein